MSVKEIRSMFLAAVSLFVLGIPLARAEDDLVLVSAGTFTMRRSLTENGVGRGFPVEITNDFHIGKYEVTVSDFRAFVDQTGYQASAEMRQRGVYLRLPDGEWATKYDFSWKKP